MTNGVAGSSANIDANSYLLVYDAKPARLRGNTIRLTIISCALSSRPTIRFDYRS